MAYYEELKAKVAQAREAYLQAWHEGTVEEMDAAWELFVALDARLYLFTHNLRVY